MQPKDFKLLDSLKKLKNRPDLQTKFSPNEAFLLTLAPSLSEIHYDLDHLEEILTSKSPFIYLKSSERELIKHSSKIIEIIGKEKEVITRKSSSNHHMMLLLEGQVFAIDPKNNYCEVLTEGDSFGADACLFGETDYSIITATEVTKILQITTETFFKLLQIERQFTLILGRNMLYKQKIFSPLENFMSFTADAANVGEVNMTSLVMIYRKIKSALHPQRRSLDLDISAWKYAIQRLPDNLTSTFVYHLTTALPDLYQNDERIIEIASKSRKRTVYKTLTGKNVIVLRDMESDLNDLLSNLCIHYIEAKKLRRKLKLPTVLNSLIETESIESLPLNPEEIAGISEIWHDKAIENIRNIILHHEDFRIIVTSSTANLRSGPSERWAETLWTGCQKALGSNFSISEAISKGLIVDVVQGSTRTLLNLISPYYKVHKDKILKWLKRSGQKLKTQEFFKDTDKLFAASYYYFKKFPEQEELKKQMENEAGVISIEETEMTGVKVMIVNVHKLKLKEIPSKSPNHLIINIGYTFGKQGFDIIKCFNLLFENCIDSFSFIGKAGGLVGSRKDVLISTKFHDMSTKGITLVNPVGVKSKLFEDLGITVHQGPMLTVAGTILQNNKLLTYYKHIEGCVGLEMEGCYFAQAIQQGIEMGLLKETVPTRFLYYVSDLPLDPNSNLAQEEGNVCWEEGVPTMTAITDHCLRLCGEVPFLQVKDRVLNFIEGASKVALVQEEWDVAQCLMNSGYSLIAFVNGESNLPKLQGSYITVDYNESVEYFLKIEGVLKSEKSDGKTIVVVMHDPPEREFWIPSKVYNNSKIRFQTIKIDKSYRNFRNSGCRGMIIVNGSLGENESCENLMEVKKQDLEFWKAECNDCLGRAYEVSQLLSKSLEL